MPRLYREAPLGSIWEGSGNVMALDVLRALRATPAALDAFLAEVDEAAGADARLDAHVARVRARARRSRASSSTARAASSRASRSRSRRSLLVRHAPPAVADAFCAARLGGAGGLAYGTLPAGADTAAIVARHTPRAERLSCGRHGAAGTRLRPW